MRFSPDGNYFAVYTERGHLDLNCVEDSLRFYRSQDARNFLEHSDEIQPSPVWIISRTGKKGGIIGDWRWLSDSGGIAFLGPTEVGNQQLILADLRTKKLERLTSATESVSAFDVRDGQHYLYSVVDSGGLRKRQIERESPMVVGTGRSIFELLLPDDSVTAFIAPSPIHLWSVVDGIRYEVKNGAVPLVSFGNFALSPDGQSFVTTLPVVDVPPSWETLYPPPVSTILPNRIHADHSHTQSSNVHQYVQINLRTGLMQDLVSAPLGEDAGWLGGGDPNWSDDGRRVLLPNTFLISEDHAPSRPCVALVDLESDTRACVEMLKGHTKTGVEEGYHRIDGARFVGGNKDRVMVTFTHPNGWSVGATEYRRAADGIWNIAEQVEGEPKAEHNGLEVSVKEGLNDPPVLVVSNKKTSRVIWDPNPEIKNLELNEATVYTWKDKKGKQWKGGLYKPTNYKAGQRYPLVIQTHGFYESEFRPSGLFSTGMAARALAAHGIMVLQAAAGVGGTNCPLLTPEEGPCMVAMYESAEDQLVSDGLVDPERVGIIGFSRTCFYVMEMLTAGSLHPKAASITDGVMEDYFQYILMPDQLPEEADPMIGAPPFGKGLQQWLKRSPGFNLDKVTAPLLVVGEGSVSLLLMWEPYAGLRYLQKPVDLLMLNTDEHVLTNPAIRMASQGGAVDWFRFWLQGYEDPDPAKQAEYVRWRGMRKLQQEEEKAAEVKN